MTRRKTPTRHDRDQQNARAGDATQQRTGADPWPFKVGGKDGIMSDTHPENLLVILDSGGGRFAYVSPEDCVGKDMPAAKARATLIAEALNRHCAPPRATDAWGPLPPGITCTAPPGWHGEARGTPGGWAFRMVRGVPRDQSIHPERGMLIEGTDVRWGDNPVDVLIAVAERAGWDVDHELAGHWRSYCAEPIDQSSPTVTIDKRADDAEASLVDQWWKRLTEPDGVPKGAPTLITRVELADAMADAALLAIDRAPAIATSSLVNDVTRFLINPGCRVAHGSLEMDLQVTAVEVEGGALWCDLTHPEHGGNWRFPFAELWPAGPVNDMVRLTVQHLSRAVITDAIAGLRESGKLRSEIPRPAEADDCMACSATGLCGSCGGVGWAIAPQVDMGVDIPAFPAVERVVDPPQAETHHSLEAHPSYVMGPGGSTEPDPENPGLPDKPNAGM